VTGPRTGGGEFVADRLGDLAGAELVRVAYTTNTSGTLSFGADLNAASASGPADHGHESERPKSPNTADLSPWSADQRVTHADHDRKDWIMDLLTQPSTDVTATSDPAIPAYVVVGLGDGMPADYDAALDFAAKEAALRHVPVKLVHGCGVGARGKESNDDQSRITAGRRLVDGAALRLQRRHPKTRVFVTNTVASAVDAVLDEAWNAQLLVVQRRDLGLLRLITPSTSAKVAARSACAVAVLQDGVRTTSGHDVVVGVDGEGRTGAAIAFAFDEAQRRGVPLSAVHAWQLPIDAAQGYVPISTSDRLQIERAAASTVEIALKTDRSRCPDVKVETRLIPGQATTALLRESANAGMLVVARHREAANSRWALGAKTHKLLAGSHCPLVIAPPTG